MKVAFYPGSFNPFHEGHFDVLSKALNVFDKVVIMQLTNPKKKTKELKLEEISEYVRSEDYIKLQEFISSGKVEIKINPNNFLFIVIGNYLLADNMKDNQYAIVRGLRNGQDLEYEKVQQYWNEDLGMKIPTVYFVADRKLTHISSTAWRTIILLQGEEHDRKT